VPPPARFFNADEYAVVAAACDRLIPPRDSHPGGAALGCADYIDGLLAAFASDPPRIWAGGPFSGRAGGDAGRNASYVRWVMTPAVDASDRCSVAWS